MRVVTHFPVSRARRRKADAVQSEDPPSRVQGAFQWPAVQFTCKSLRSQVAARPISGDLDALENSAPPRLREGRGSDFQREGAQRAHLHETIRFHTEAKQSNAFRCPCVGSAAPHHITSERVDRPGAQMCAVQTRWLRWFDGGPRASQTVFSAAFGASFAGAVPPRAFHRAPSGWHEMGGGAKGGRHLRAQQDGRAGVSIAVPVAVISRP